MDRLETEAGEGKRHLAVLVQGHVAGQRNCAHR